MFVNGQNFTYDAAVNPCAYGLWPVANMVDAAAAAAAEGYPPGAPAAAVMALNICCCC